MIFNALFLLFVFAFTFYGLFKDQELPELMGSLHLANGWYLLLGVGLVIVFVCSESVIIHYMMKALGDKVPFLNCVKYSFIGFFFSCITPSASGGQPAQIYYMKKDNIDIPVSTLVLMIVTIGYKLVLVVMGVFLFLFQRNLLHQYMNPMTNFFLYLGIFLNVIGIGGLLLLVFRPSLVKRILCWCQKLIIKLHILKKESHSFMKSIDKYHETAEFFKSHLKVMLNVFYLSVFQRVCLFYVTYLVYRSFGLHGTSAYTIVMLQAVIALSVDMLPLPGGMGASENLFLAIFLPIFGQALILPSMLLSRGISYYTLLLISALVTVYAHLMVIYRKDRESRKEVGISPSLEKE